MKLYEYQSATLFREHGIPFPDFRVVSTPEAAKSAARELGLPVVVKVQVLVGGRGKAGGVRIAHSVEDVERAASELIGRDIRGEVVKSVMIAKAVPISTELYLSLLIDRTNTSYLLMASREGGVDIEVVAKRSPEKIFKFQIDPLVGFRSYLVSKVSKAMKLSDQQRGQISRILEGIYEIFTKYHCELVEINPLAVTSDGNLMALDAKVILDDNAQRISRSVPFAVEEEGLEAEAKRHGFSYVELDGNIGIIGNGAGLTMATMDLVKYYGGRPANFLDLGGGADAERMYRAASFLLRNKRVDVLLVNVLGGITRCDEMAKGLVTAMKELGEGKKLVVRLVGTNEAEGREILVSNGYEYFDSMDEAAKKAVELAGS